jgi:hypothetical protein
MRLGGPSIHQELERSVLALAAGHDMQERFLLSRGYHISVRLREDLYTR